MKLIVVRTFPDPNKGNWTISSGGGTEPRWRRNDGGELYYLSDGKVMVVEMTRDAKLVPGTPKELFPAPPLSPHRTRPLMFRYDVTADGQRFIFSAESRQSMEPTTSQPIITILNWTGALKKK